MAQTKEFVYKFTGDFSGLTQGVEQAKESIDGLANSADTAKKSIEEASQTDAVKGTSDISQQYGSAASILQQLNEQLTQLSALRSSLTEDTQASPLTGILERTKAEYNQIAGYFNKINKLQQSGAKIEDTSFNSGSHSIGQLGATVQQLRDVNRTFSSSIGGADAKEVLGWLGQSNDISARISQLERQISAENKHTTNVSQTDMDYRISRDAGLQKAIQTRFGESVDAQQIVHAARTLSPTLNGQGNAVIASQAYRNVPKVYTKKEQLPEQFQDVFTRISSGKTDDASRLSGGTGSLSSAVRRQLLDYANNPQNSEVVDTLIQAGLATRKNGMNIISDNPSITQANILASIATRRAHELSSSDIRYQQDGQTVDPMSRNSRRYQQQIGLLGILSQDKNVSAGVYSQEQIQEALKGQPGLDSRVEYYTGTGKGTLHYNISDLERRLGENEAAKASTGTGILSEEEEQKARSDLKTYKGYLEAAKIHNLSYEDQLLFPKVSTFDAGGKVEKLDMDHVDPNSMASMGQNQFTRMLNLHGQNIQFNGGLGGARTKEGRLDTAQKPVFMSVDRTELFDPVTGEFKPGADVQHDVDLMNGKSFLNYDGNEYEFAYRNGTDAMYMDRGILQQARQSAAQAGLAPLFSYGNVRGLSRSKDAASIIKQQSAIHRGLTPSTSYSDLGVTGISPAFVDTDLLRDYAAQSGAMTVDQAANHYVDSAILMDRSQFKDLDFDAQFRGLSGTIKGMAQNVDYRKMLRENKSIQDIANRTGKDANPFIFYDRDEKGNIIRDENGQGNLHMYLPMTAMGTDYAKHQGFMSGIMDQVANPKTFKATRQQLLQDYFYDIMDPKYNAVISASSMKNEEKASVLDEERFKKLFDNDEEAQQHLKAAKVAGRYNDQEEEFQRTEDNSTYKSHLIHLTADEQARYAKKWSDYEGGYSAVKTDQGFQVKKGIMPASLVDSLPFNADMRRLSSQGYDKRISELQTSAFAQEQFLKSNPKAAQIIKENPGTWQTNSDIKSLLNNEIDSLQQSREKGDLYLGDDAMIQLAKVHPGEFLYSIGALGGLHEDDISKSLTEQGLNPHLEDGGEYSISSLFGKGKGEYSSSTPYEVLGTRMPAAAGNNSIMRLFDVNDTDNAQVKALKKYGANLNSGSFMSVSALKRMNTGDFDGDTVWLFNQMADEFSEIKRFNTEYADMEKELGNTVQKGQSPDQQKAEAVLKAHGFQTDRAATRQFGTKAVNGDLGQLYLQGMGNAMRSTQGMGLGSAAIRDANVMGSLDESDRIRALIEASQYYDFATSEMQNKGLQGRMGAHAFDIVQNGRLYNRFMKTIDEDNAKAAQDRNYQISDDQNSLFKNNVVRMDDLSGLTAIRENQISRINRGIGYGKFEKDAMNWTRQAYSDPRSARSQAARWYTDLFTGTMTGRHFANSEDLAKGDKLVEDLQAEIATSGGKAPVTEDALGKVQTLLTRLRSGDLLTQNGLQEGIEREAAAASVAKDRYLSGTSAADKYHERGDQDEKAYLDEMQGVFNQAAMERYNAASDAQKKSILQQNGISEEKFNASKDQASLLGYKGFKDWRKHYDTHTLYNGLAQGQQKSQLANIFANADTFEMVAKDEKLAGALNDQQKGQYDTYKELVEQRRNQIINAATKKQLTRNDHTYSSVTTIEPWMAVNENENPELYSGRKDKVVITPKSEYTLDQNGHAANESVKAQPVDLRNVDDSFGIVDKFTEAATGKEGNQAAALGSLMHESFQRYWQSYARNGNQTNGLKSATELLSGMMAGGGAGIDSRTKEALVGSGLRIDNEGKISGWNTDSKVAGTRNIENKYLAIAGTGKTGVMDQYTKYIAGFGDTIANIEGLNLQSDGSYYGSDRYAKLETPLSNEQFATAQIRPDLITKRKDGGFTMHDYKSSQGSKYSAAVQMMLYNKGMENYVRKLYDVDENGHANKTADTVDKSDGFYQYGQVDENGQFKYLVDQLESFSLGDKDKSVGKVSTFDYNNMMAADGKTKMSDALFSAYQQSVRKAQETISGRYSDKSEESQAVRAKATELAMQQLREENMLPVDFDPQGVQKAYAGQKVSGYKIDNKSGSNGSIVPIYAPQSFKQSRENLAALEKSVGKQEYAGYKEQRYGEDTFRPYSRFDSYRRQLQEGSLDQDLVQKEIDRIQSQGGNVDIQELSKIAQMEGSIGNRINVAEIAAATTDPLKQIRQFNLMAGNTAEYKNQSQYDSLRYGFENAKFAVNHLRDQYVAGDDDAKKALAGMSSKEIFDYYNNDDKWKTKANLEGLTDENARTLQRNRAERAAAAKQAFLSFYDTGETGTSRYDELNKSYQDAVAYMQKQQNLGNIASDRRMLTAMGVEGFNNGNADLGYESLRDKINQRVNQIKAKTSPLTAEQKAYLGANDTAEKIDANARNLNRKNILESTDYMDPYYAQQQKAIKNKANAQNAYNEAMNMPWGADKANRMKGLRYYMNGQDYYTDPSYADRMENMNYDNLMNQTESSLMRAKQMQSLTHPFLSKLTYSKGAQLRDNKLMQLRSTQSTLTSNRQSILKQMSKYGASVNDKGEVSYGKNFQSGDKGKVDQLKGQYDKLTKSINSNKQAQSSLAGVTGIMKSSINGVVQSLGNMASMFGRRMFYKAIQQITSFATSFDKAMTQIQMATLKTDSQTSDLGQSLIDKAKQLHVSVSDVTTAATALYRQGLSDQQVNESLDQVIKFSKTAGVSSADALKLITVAKNNGLVSTSAQATDVISALGDSNATNAADLTKVIQKTAGAAGQVGMDYNSLVAMATGILSKTQLGGSNVGTFLNTAMSRYGRVSKNQISIDENGQQTSMSDVASVLGALGINVMDTSPGHANGQMRDFQDVMVQIADKWDDFTDLQKQQISYVMAGTKQYSNFSASMAALSEKDANGKTLYQKNLELAKESEGSTEKKYSIYSESLAASLATLQTAFDDFVSTLVTSGVLQDIVNFFTDMINGLTDIIDEDGWAGILQIISNAIIGSMVGGIFGQPVAGAALALGGTSIIHNEFGPKSEKQILTDEYKQAQRLNTKWSFGNITSEEKQLLIKDLKDLDLKGAIDLSGLNGSVKDLDISVEDIIKGDKNVATASKNIATSLEGAAKKINQIDIKKSFDDYVQSKINEAQTHDKGVATSYVDEQTGEVVLQYDTSAAGYSPTKDINLQSGFTKDKFIEFYTQNIKDDEEEAASQYWKYYQGDHYDQDYIDSINEFIKNNSSGKTEVTYLDTSSQSGISTISTQPYNPESEKTELINYLKDQAGFDEDQATSMAGKIYDQVVSGDNKITSSEDFWTEVRNKTSDLTDLTPYMSTEGGSDDGSSGGQDPSQTSKPLTFKERAINIGKSADYARQTTKKDYSEAYDSAYQIMERISNALPDTQARARSLMRLGVQGKISNLNQLLQGDEIGSSAWNALASGQYGNYTEDYWWNLLMQSFARNSKSYTPEGTVTKSQRLTEGRTILDRFKNKTASEKGSIYASLGPQQKAAINDIWGSDYFNSYVIGDNISDEEMEHKYGVYENGTQVQDRQRIADAALAILNGENVGEDLYNEVTAAIPAVADYKAGISNADYVRAKINGYNYGKDFQGEDLYNRAKLILETGKRPDDMSDRQYEQIETAVPAVGDYLEKGESAKAYASAKLEEYMHRAGFERDILADQAEDMLKNGFDGKSEDQIEEASTAIPALGDYRKGYGNETYVQAMINGYRGLPGFEGDVLTSQAQRIIDLGAIPDNMSDAQRDYIYSVFPAIEAMVKKTGTKVFAQSKLDEYNNKPGFKDDVLAAQAEKILRNGNVDGMSQDQIDAIERAVPAMQDFIEGNSNETYTRAKINEYKGLGGFKGLVMSGQAQRLLDAGTILQDMSKSQLSQLYATFPGLQEYIENGTGKEYAQASINDYNNEVGFENKILTSQAEDVLENGIEGKSQDQLDVLFKTFPALESYIKKYGSKVYARAKINEYKGQTGFEGATLSGQAQRLIDAGKILDDMDSNQREQIFSTVKGVREYVQGTGSKVYAQANLDAYNGKKGFEGEVLAAQAEDILENGITGKSEDQLNDIYAVLPALKEFVKGNSNETYVRSMINEYRGLAGFKGTVMSEQAQRLLDAGEIPANMDETQRKQLYGTFDGLQDYIEGTGSKVYAQAKIDEYNGKTGFKGSALSKQAQRLIDAGTILSDMSVDQRKQIYSNVEGVQDYIEGTGNKVYAQAKLDEYNGKAGFDETLMASEAQRIFDNGGIRPEDMRDQQYSQLTNAITGLKEYVEYSSMTQEERDERGVTDQDIQYYKDLAQNNAYIQSVQDGKYTSQVQEILSEIYDGKMSSVISGYTSGQNNYNTANSAYERISSGRGLSSDYSTLSSYVGVDSDTLKQMSKTSKGKKAIEAMMKKKLEEDTQAYADALQKSISSDDLKDLGTQPIDTSTLKEKLKGKVSDSVLQLIDTLGLSWNGEKLVVNADYTTPTIKSSKETAEDQIGTKQAQDQNNWFELERLRTTNPDSFYKQYGQYYQTEDIKHSAQDTDRLFNERYGSTNMSFSDSGAALIASNLSATNPELYNRLIGYQLYGNGEGKFSDGTTPYSYYGDNLMMYGANAEAAMAFGQGNIGAYDTKDSRGYTTMWGINQAAAQNIMNSDTMRTGFESTYGSEASTALTQLAQNGYIAENTMEALNDQFGEDYVSQLTKYASNASDIASAVQSIHKGGSGAIKTMAGIVDEVNNLGNARSALAKFKKGDRSDQTTSTLAGLGLFDANSLKNMTGGIADSASNMMDDAIDAMGSQLNTKLQQTMNASLDDFTASIPTDKNFDINTTFTINGQADATQALAAIESAGIQIDDAVRAQILALAQQGATFALKYVKTGDDSFKVQVVEGSVDTSGVKKGSYNGNKKGSGGNKKSKASQLADKLSYINKEYENALSLNSSAQDYYQTTGQLTMYGKTLEQALDINEAYKKQIQSNLTQLKKQQKSLTAGTDDWKTITDAIHTNEQALAKVNTTIAQTTKKIKENEEAIRQTYITLESDVSDQIKNRIAIEESELDARVDMEDTVLEAIKNRYQDEWDLIKKDIEKKKEALEEEKSLIEERLNRRKEAADEAQKYEELEEYKKQLAYIESDSSRTKEAKELREKIADLEEEIGWDIAEDEAEAETNRLQDEIDAYDEYTSNGDDYMEDFLSDDNNFADEVNAVMSLTQDELYSWLSANVEDFTNSLADAQKNLLQEWEDVYDEMIDRTGTYWDKTKEILTSKDSFLAYMKESDEYKNASDTDKKSLEYQWGTEYDDWTNANSTTDTSALPSIVSVLNNIYQVVKDIKNGNWSGSSSGSGTATTGATSSSSSSSKKTKTLYKITYTVTFGGSKNKKTISGYTSSYAAIQAAQSKAKALAKQYKAKGFSTSWSYSSPVAYTVSYKTGGVADFTGPAWLDGTKQKPERILSAKQTSLFDNMVSTLESLESSGVDFDFIKDIQDWSSKINFTPAMSSVGSEETSGNTATIGDVYVTLNEAQINDDSDYDEIAEKVGQKFAKELNKQGLHLASYTF